MKKLAQKIISVFAYLYAVFQYIVIRIPILNRFGNITTYFNTKSNYYLINFKLKYYTDRITSVYKTGKLFKMFSHGKYTLVQKDEKSGKFSIDNSKNDRVFTNMLHQKAVKIINYQDGDSFFEVGCGAGQNLIHIQEKFPSSKMNGCDVTDAISYAQEYFANGSFTQLDLKEFNSLKFIESNSIDHVFMSHVMSFIFVDNIEETIRLRQHVFNEMVRISKKSITIFGGALLNSTNKEAFRIAHLGKNIANLEFEINDLVNGCSEDLDYRFFVPETNIAVFIGLKNR